MGTLSVTLMFVSILHMKYLIYSCKRHDRKPSFDGHSHKFIFASSIKKYNEMNKMKKTVTLQYRHNAFNVCPVLLYKATDLLNIS